MSATTPDPRVIAAWFHKAEVEEDLVQASQVYELVVEYISGFEPMSLDGSDLRALGVALARISTGTEAAIKTRREHAEKALLAALEKDSLDGVALYELGILWFYSERYTDVEALTGTLRPAAFIALGQEWRYGKLLELRTCSLIYLDWLSEASTALSEMIQAYDALKEVDLIPLLSELAHCIAKHSRHLFAHEDLSLMMQHFSEFTERIGQKEALRSIIGNVEPSQS